MPADFGLDGSLDRHRLDDYCFRFNPYPPHETYLYPSINSRHLRHLRSTPRPGSVAVADAEPTANATAVITYEPLSNLDASVILQPLYFHGQTLLCGTPCRLTPVRTTTR